MRHWTTLCSSEVSSAQGFPFIYSSGPRPGELQFPESSTSLKSPKNKLLQSLASPSIATSLWAKPSLAWGCTSAQRFSIKFPLWDTFRWAFFLPRTAHQPHQSLNLKSSISRCFCPIFPCLYPKEFCFLTPRPWILVSVHMQRAERVERHKSSQSAAVINVDKWIKFVTSPVSPPTFLFSSVPSNLKTVQYPFHLQVAALNKQWWMLFIPFFFPPLSPPSSHSRLSCVFYKGIV